MVIKSELYFVDVGIYTPTQKPLDVLGPVDVGYITASIKTLDDVHVGDTITHVHKKASEPLPGYRTLNPVVFCGLYPIDPDQYMDLKEALEKLKLNDASLVFEPESSQALGFGFRSGFLGLLHMDIIQERIYREFNIDLIATA